MGRVTAEERFWSKVDKSNANGCWFWTSTVGSSGYGQFYYEGKRYGAHAFAFFLENGRFPNPCALHTCDVPNCVRPDHIFEGTKKDNTLDMMRKGRHKHGPGNIGKKGSESSNARFTEQQIKNMKDMLSKGATLQEVATKYKSHKSYISLIKRGLRWPHIQ